MDTAGIEKAQSFKIADLIDSVPHSVMSKDIIKKTTGSIAVLAIDTHKEITRKISPFDVFIEIIEGSAEILIDNKSVLLEMGEAIIIPAHTLNSINAGTQCKMLETIIKSGYEQEL